MAPFDAQELREQGVSQALINFIEWVDAQGVDVVIQVAVRINIIADVQEGKLTVLTAHGTVPHAWAMEKAAADLRDIAQAAGFVEAARLCEKDRQSAQELIIGLQQFGIGG